MRLWLIEAWLTLATYATERALNLCRMPEDEDTIRRIHDSTKVWLDR